MLSGGDPLFDGSRSSGASSGLRSGGSLSDSVRTGFNHVNDIFSQFTKHISPSYHHERPERWGRKSPFLGLWNFLSVVVYPTVFLGQRHLTHV